MEFRWSLRDPVQKRGEDPVQKKEEDPVQKKGEDPVQKKGEDTNKYNDTVCLVQFHVTKNNFKKCCHSNCTDWQSKSETDSQWILFLNCQMEEEEAALSFMQLMVDPKETRRCPRGSTWTMQEARY